LRGEKKKVPFVADSRSFISTDKKRKRSKGGAVLFLHRREERGGEKDKDPTLTAYISLQKKEKGKKKEDSGR